MCGLMAGSGSMKSQVIMSLCVSNVTRGEDSAGVGYWREKARIRKIAQHPLTAFPLTLKDAIDSAGKSPAMIGHTRQASCGAVTNPNAHPFLVDGIAFAHNGVLQNADDFGDYEVDSQALIHGIKARNFSKYVGSIALVWLENGKLHAFRKGNPLFRGNIGGAIYLASEKEFLTRLFAKNVSELKEGMLYTFHKDAIERCNAIPENKVYRYQRYVVPPISYDASDWPDTTQEARERGLMLPTFAPTELNSDIPKLGDN